MTRGAIRCSKRSARGLTLIELVSSLTSATVLLAGLATAVGISIKSVDHLPLVTEAMNVAGSGVSSFAYDINDATEITAVGEDAVSLVVPDRTGDGVAETIGYAVQDGSLYRTQNLKDAKRIASELDAVEFVAAGPALSDAVESFREPGSRCWVYDIRTAATENTATELTFAVPAGTASGDLLIAAVGTRDNTSTSLSAPVGWTRFRTEAYGSYLTICLWYRIADGTESTARFNWLGNEHACGWIVGIRGADPESPISQTQLHGGLSYSFFPYYRVVGDLYLDRPNLYHLRFAFAQDDSLFDQLALMRGFSNLEWTKAPASNAVIETVLTGRNEPNYWLSTPEQYCYMDDPARYISGEILIRPAAEFRHGG